MVEKSMNIQNQFEKLIVKFHRQDDEILLKSYLAAIRKQPKPADMSQSLYLTCLALHMLEESGNPFPTQEEINVVEKAFKRYSRRKTLAHAIKIAA
jgi:hypothetical protein